MYGWDAACIGFRWMRIRAERSDVMNHVVVDHILFGNASDLQNVRLACYHEPRVEVFLFHTSL